MKTELTLGMPGRVNTNVNAISDLSQSHGNYALKADFHSGNKHRIGPNQNKIEPAHELSLPIFCSSLNLQLG